MNTQELDQSESEMCTQIGTGEFVREFLYQLYLLVKTYGYDQYGEYDGWQSMTLAEQTTLDAHCTVSFAHDDVFGV